MLIPAGDQELLERQEALQAEAGRVLAELDLSGLFADVGPVLLVGSYLSGLMVWRTWTSACWPMWTARPRTSWSC
jgi:hypothetical protein